MIMYFIILSPATTPLSWINGNIHGGEATFLNRWHRCIRLERKNDRKDRQKGRYLIDSAICQSAGNFKSLFGILHHSSLLRKNVCFENLNVALKQNLSANLRQIFQDTNVQVWLLTLARRGLMTRKKSIYHPHSMHAIYRIGSKYKCMEVKLQPSQLFLSIWLLVLESPFQIVQCRVS